MISHFTKGDTHIPTYLLQEGSLCNARLGIKEWGICQARVDKKTEKTEI